MKKWILVIIFMLSVLLLSVIGAKVRSRNAAAQQQPSLQELRLQDQKVAPQTWEQGWEAARR